MIHGSNQKIVKTMDVALWLSVADTHGREIWGGSLRRMGDAHPYSVGDAVETLCGYLPSRQRPELPAPQ